jgi:hypothetical protein
MTEIPPVTVETDEEHVRRHVVRLDKAQVERHILETVMRLAGETGDPAACTLDYDVTFLEDRDNGGKLAITSITARLKVNCLAPTSTPAA